MLDSIEDFLRRHVKKVSNVPIMWKVMVLAFLIIGDLLIWNIGNGNRVTVG
jgi:hypothetical protein